MLLVVLLDVHALPSMVKHTLCMCASKHVMLLLMMQGSSSSFAQTGHAMRLLQSVAVAAQQQEPALLVGETGTGKTTLVQRLADQVSPMLCTHCFAVAVCCFAKLVPFAGLPWPFGSASPAKQQSVAALEAPAADN